jgi:DnaJ-class molecular chaperone
MADGDCPTCEGKGKVQEVRTPTSGKLTESPWVKCKDWDGTGKRKR